MGDEERWVRLSELYKTIENELGISEFTARKRIRPDLENLNIDAQFRSLHPDIHRLFALQHAVLPMPRPDGSAITKIGWSGVDEHGRLVGHPVSVRWTHILESLADLIGRPVAFEPKKELPRDRKRGGRDYRKADAPLIEEMHELIKSGKASNATDAARQIVLQAAGGGTEDSKTKRLAMQYLVRFSSDPNDVD